MSYFSLIFVKSRAFFTIFLLLNKKVQKKLITDNIFLKIKRRGFIIEAPNYVLGCILDYAPTPLKMSVPGT